MKVTFSPKALSALDEIHAYIACDSPRAAGDVIALIESLCLKLGDFPGMGRATSLDGVRMIPAERYPYIIFYAVLPDDREVRILRVRHAARRPLEPDEI
jgi:plasmid stabilization system protein ParE